MLPRGVGDRSEPAGPAPLRAREACRGAWRSARRVAGPRGCVYVRCRGRAGTPQSAARIHFPQAARLAPCRGHNRGAEEGGRGWGGERPAGAISAAPACAETPRANSWLNSAPAGQDIWERTKGCWTKTCTAVGITPCCFSSRTCTRSLRSWASTRARSSPSMRRWGKWTASREQAQIPAGSW